MDIGEGADWSEFKRKGGTLGDLLRRAHALTVGPGTGTARASAFRLLDGDIRLLSGLEEVVAAMRRGADELERWGRCADMHRIEKVRRLAVLVGGLNQQLGAEVVTAVAALADIEASQSDHRVPQAVERAA